VTVRNGRSKGVRVNKIFARKLAVTFAVSAALIGAVPAGTASAAQSCDFSFTTNKFGCSGSGGIRGGSDVIGARIFTGTDYTGDVLTIWVPRPCPKNDNVDHALALNGSQWRNRVKSAQAWSSCWVWLYEQNGNRQGPFKQNHPDLSSAGGNRTVTVGLS
jgi:hypothetical protein